MNEYAAKILQLKFVIINWNYFFQLSSSSEKVEHLEIYL